MSRIRRVLTAVATAWLLIPALADPSTADAIPTSNGNVSASSGAIYVVGSGAGTGTWRLTSSGGSVTVATDGGGSLSNSGGCTQSGLTVVCSGSPTIIYVDLRGMTSGQTVDVDPSVAIRVEIIGTNHNDTLNGGSGDDQISGLKGADEINGRGGSDTAFYGTDESKGQVEKDRIAGIVVTLDGVANDGSSDFDEVGPAGRGKDNVGTTTENVYGTNYADTLTGDGKSNLLDGRAGDDELTGGLGSDRLVGQLGNDTLNADDGVADAEVNCNDSDESRDQQPNTVRYDTGLDNPANCGLASSGGGGGSGGGSGPGSTAGKGAFRLIDDGGTWIVPKTLMPRKAGGGWSFTPAKRVRTIVGAAPFPITVTWKQVGRFDVPLEYRQKKIPEDAIVRVSPTVGGSVSGSVTSPGEIIITTYSGAVDLPRTCPYGDPDLTRVIQGDDLAVAARTLKRMRCSFRVGKMQFTESFGQPSVTAARVVVDDDGKKRVSLTVRYPADTLSLTIGPDGGANELTIDDDGVLRVAPKNLTTIQIRALDSSLGIPSTKNTTVEVRTQSGEVLASQTIGSGANGGVQSLTFGVREFGPLRVVATAYDDAKMRVLHGSRFIRVSQAKTTLRTADIRCFVWKETSEKFKSRDCLKLQAASKARAAYTRTLVSTELARLVVERVLGNSIQGTLNTFAQADEICFSDKKTVTIPSFEYYWQSFWDEKARFPGAPGCSDAEIIELMRVFKLTPIQLSGSSKATGDPVLAAVAFATSVGVIGGELREGSSPAINAESKPALGIERGGVITFGNGMFIDARKGLDGNALINLDGGGLINLDGGTLAAYEVQPLIAAGGQNLKAMDQALLDALGGGSLINLDGGTLINLDGGTMQAQGGQNLIAKDGAALKMDAPLNLILDRGEALTAVQALARLK